MNPAESIAYSYIRWSTPDQKLGDSERRQLDAAQKWCATNGVKLADRQFLDAGLSGFKATHLKKGQLKVFLDACEAGEIARGSYLIVENYDRLTRQNPLQAQDLIRKICGFGVSVVLLSDGKVITQKTFDDAKLEDLLVLTINLARSNMESKRKQELLQKTWEGKRLKVKAGKKSLGNNCPSWLRMNDDKTAFIVDAGKAETIRRIFELKLEGKGGDAISTVLNQENRATFGTGKKQAQQWTKKLVNNITDNPRVIGTLVLGTYKDGKRVLTGEEVKGYYPAVISEADFYKVNQRKVAGKKFPGRQRHDTANLFRGLLYCQHCGTRAQIKVKDMKRGYIWLRCPLQKCVAFGNNWKYATFERLAIAEVADVLQRGAVVSKIESKMPELEALKSAKVAQLAKIEKQLQESEDVATLAKVARSLENSIKAIHKDMEKETARLSAISSTADASVIQYMRTLKDDAERGRVINYLRTAVARVEVDTITKSATVRWETGGVNYFEEAHQDAPIVVEE